MKAAVASICALLGAAGAAEAASRPLAGGAADMDCTAISPLVTDQWCDENCALGPQACPSNLCECAGSGSGSGGGGSGSGSASSGSGSGLPPAQDDDYSPPPAQDDDATPAPVYCADRALNETRPLKSRLGDSARVVTGYLCPTCSSTPDPVDMEGMIHKRYDVVAAAFIAWNDDGSVYSQLDDTSKEFWWSSDFNNDLHLQGRTVLASMGGGASGTLDCGADAAFATTMATSLADFLQTNAFDGVDLDIEHRSGDYNACGALMGSMLEQLRAAMPDVVVTIAPQMGNLYPDGEGVSGGTNELAPLIGPAINCFDAVMPQMYNTWAAVETTAYAHDYAVALTQGYTVENEGVAFTVQVPASKLHLGYPSSTSAAGSGYVDPADIVALVDQLADEGVDLAGVMTWDLGWDFQNQPQWAFAEGVADV